MHTYKLKESNLKKKTVFPDDRFLEKYFISLHFT